MLSLVALAWSLLASANSSSGNVAVTAARAYKASQDRELGLLYQQQERYPLAIATMKKSVELDPKNIMGRVNLGWAQHKAGQENAAAASLLGAVYREPKSVPALNALGIVYLVRGNLPAAVLVHTRAAVLQPDDEIAYYNLSLAFERLGLYNSATSTAVRAANLEPDNPHPLVALAIADWQQGNRSKAERAYQKALALDSRYSDRSFLPSLQQAGFSPSQIQTVEKVRSNRG